jgi:hypothetical protein
MLCSIRDKHSNISLGQQHCLSKGRKGSEGPERSCAARALQLPAMLSEAGPQQHSLQCPAGATLL